MDKEKRKEDIIRIQKVSINNNYLLSYNQCEEIWRDYSDSFTSKWLNLPPTDEILWENIKWRVLKHYI